MLLRTAGESSKCLVPASPILNHVAKLSVSVWLVVGVAVALVLPSSTALVKRGGACCKGPRTMSPPRSPPQPSRSPPQPPPRFIVTSYPHSGSSGPGSTAPSSHSSPPVFSPNLPPGTFLTFYSHHGSSGPASPGSDSGSSHHSGVNEMPGSWPASPHSSHGFSPPPSGSATTASSRAPSSRG